MKRIKLDDKHTHPFEVPEGYFSELQEAILSETTQKEAPKPIVWWHKSMVQWSLSFVFLAVLGLVMYLNVGQQQENPDFLAGISDDEIITYLSYYDLEPSEIVQHIPEAELDEMFEQDMLLEDLELEEGTLDDLYLQYELNDQTMEI